MKLFLDCEWSDDQLLSLALVPETRALPVFYAELEHDKETLSPWVQENVVLNGAPHPRYRVQRELSHYLAAYDEGVHIIADWPEDIARICMLLITSPGSRINTPPLTFEVVRLDGVSAEPHYALADAKALREIYLETYA